MKRNEPPPAEAQRQQADDRSVSIIGAGPAGSLMAVLLARLGYNVAAYERLPDLRTTLGTAGRSINLALADRGIHALRVAGAFDDVEPLLTPMRGRMLHDLDGRKTFLPYGQREREVIYSVSRTQLTQALLSRAEREGATVTFRQTCLAVDAATNALRMQDLPSGRMYDLPLQHVIGADGAGSVLRHHLVESQGARCDEQFLTHGYKELTIPSDAHGRHRLHVNALHIWPRGDFMLIALPNLDGTFTATLFLQLDGQISFAKLNTADAVVEFFRQHFPDAAALMPDLAREFMSHPTGMMGTVRLDRWTLDEQLLLIGDAAHAVVPFHGQGMNCALEDCVELHKLLANGLNWRDAAQELQRRRKPNADAIADMALENYVEMRDTVRHPKFQLQKELSLELERRFPDRFIPRYSMVMFHHEIPYAAAYERGAIQQDILNALTESAERLDQIDYTAAQRLIEARLSPLTP